MSVSTNAAGVAICSCGHELEIRCTGGCVLPDPVFKPIHDPNAICNWSGCHGVSVRGYRPTALREAHRITSAPHLWESWVEHVTAYRLRRIRDDQVLDHTEVEQRTPHRTERN